MAKKNENVPESLPAPEPTRRSLTPKMREACFLYLETNDKTEAYKRAYDADPDAKNNHTRAKELFNLPQVAEFLEMLYERSRNRHEIDIDRITKNLLEDRQLAFTTEDAKAAVASDIALAKLHGLMIDRKRHEIAGTLEHHIGKARERVLNHSGPGGAPSIPHHTHSEIIGEFKVENE